MALHGYGTVGDGTTGAGEAMAGAGTDGTVGTTGAGEAMAGAGEASIPGVHLTDITTDGIILDMVDEM